MVAGRLRCLRAARQGAAQGAPVAAANRASALSGAVLVFHALAFAVMYGGVGMGVFGSGAAAASAGQRWVGALFIAAAAGTAGAALAVMRSWRLQAALDTGHELATGGVFALVRHPIYLAFDLLALGSALWAPNLLSILGLVLMAVSGDARARAEEKVLLAEFGEAYRRYGERTARFVPGLY